MYVDIPSLGPVLLFATAAPQASPSFTISRSLLRLMSIELVMPSNHLILSLSQLRVLFQWIGSLHQVAKVLQFQHQSSQCNEYSGFDVWIF